jgi:hypothetical protein
MTGKESACDPFSYLVDSFWASLPEKTADELATFKKDVLRGIKEAVDRFVDEGIARTDWHLENARRMRERYRQSEAGDIPPNPA